MPAGLRQSPRPCLPARPVRWRKSAPRRPHACAAARARHLSHCAHFTSLSARKPSSGPRAGGACVFYHMNGFMRFRRPPPFFFGAWPPSSRAGGVSGRRAFVPTGTRRSCPAYVRRSLQYPLQNMLRAASVARSTPRPPACPRLRLLAPARAYSHPPASARAYLPGPCVRRKFAPAPARARACRTPAGMSSLPVCPPLSAPPFPPRLAKLRAGRSGFCPMPQGRYNPQDLSIQKSMWPCAVKSR